MSDFWTVRYLKQVLPALVVLVAVDASIAQENPARMDSIIPLLDPARHDTSQLDMLIAMAESWATSPNAFPYLARLDTLSNELLGHPSAAVRKRAQHARGAFNYFTGYHAKFARNVPLALRSFQQAIRDFGVNKEQHALGECYDALGILFRVVGEHGQAEIAFREELRIARAIAHDKLTTQALVHLAALRIDRKDLDGALALLDSCGRGAPEDSSAVLNERARILMAQGQSEKATLILKESLLCAARSDNGWDQLPVLAPLARWHLRNGPVHEAAHYAHQCADLAQRMGDLTAQSVCLVLEADALHAQGDREQVENLLNKALALAQVTGNVGAARELGDEGSQVEITSRLKDLYTEQGRDKEASRMTVLWVDLKDSVARMNGREELMTMEFQKELYVDSVAHALEAQHNATVHEQNLSEERARRNILLVTVLAVVAVAIALWSRWRLQKRSNAAILSAQERLIESERQREASEVRTRIARDVHDQLGSDLTKLVMLSGEVRALAVDDPASLRATANDIERVAGEANRSLGDIVWAIDPHHDSLAELTERVRAHSERMLKWSHIAHTIDCVHTGPDVALDPATKRDLYLILREALNNSIKYAKARHISVRFYSSVAKVEMEVKDDGVGLDATNTIGHGSVNMRQRAERPGARMRVVSAKGRGTSIILELDLSLALHA